MSIVYLNDGQQVLWEPTTDLVCPCCQEPIDIHTLTRGSKEAANFMFDFRHPQGGDGLTHGEYWYLHKRCAGIERLFLRGGVPIHWGWHPMRWVLGLDETWNNHFGNLARFLYQHMPEGIYERLYEHWRPAIRGNKPGFLFKRRVVKMPKTPDEPVAKSYVVLPGYVYLIEAIGTGRVKIGRSFSAILRLESLETASPFDLRILRQIKTEDCVGLERNLHARYVAYKVRREWFALPTEILAALLKEEFVS